MGLLELRSACSAFNRLAVLFVLVVFNCWVYCGVDRTLTTLLLLLLAWAVFFVAVVSSDCNSSWVEVVPGLGSVSALNSCCINCCTTEFKSFNCDWGGAATGAGTSKGVTCALVPMTGVTLLSDGASWASRAVRSGCGAWEGANCGVRAGCCVSCARSVSSERWGVELLSVFLFIARCSHSAIKSHATSYSVSRCSVAITI